MPDTWDYTNDPLAGAVSVVFSTATNHSAGATYDFGTNYNEVYISFLFRFTAAPTNFSLEVMDLYDTNADEICDTYLNTFGQLVLYFGANATGVSALPPTNTTFKVWVHFNHNAGTNGAATLAWDTPDAPEPTSGTHFVSDNEGFFGTPTTRILWGPVSEDGVTFYYDELNVSLPARSYATAGTLHITTLKSR